MINYDDSMIEEIINNIDLLEYAEQTCDFEKKGESYFTNCPNHTDLTPSLSITPKKNRFHCFSCGCKGTIIKWLMEYEELSFDSAIEKASKLANVDLSTMCTSQTVRYLRRTNKTITTKEAFVHPILDKSVMNSYLNCEITEWIEEGISKEVLDLYEVMIDERSNRIIYPVYTVNGELINIKARTRFIEYKKMKLKKYVNFYKVGIVDYFQGLNISIKDVVLCGEIIIFESIKSTMKLRTNGKNNSASAEKHTLTNEQITLLIKLKVNVVLAYDTDVSYFENEVKVNIDNLKRFTNVYVIEDHEELLGGKEAKNSPIDLGFEIWEHLYENKRKII